MQRRAARVFRRDGVGGGEKLPELGLVDHDTSISINA